MGRNKGRAAVEEVGSMGNTARGSEATAPKIPTRKRARVAKAPAEWKQAACPAWGCMMRPMDYQKQESASDRPKGEMLMRTHLMWNTPSSGQG